MSAMKGQIGMMRHIAGLIFLGLLVSVPCAEAQQQEPQQPTPAPSEPKDTDAKSGKDAKEKEKLDPTVGKSKLEKEKGTVNRSNL